MFEKDRRAGGAFRYAGLAPMFQEVEANPDSLLRATSATWSRHAGSKGVNFRFATDVTRDPLLLAPFDRIVIATGAAYPLGLGPMADGAAGARRRDTGRSCRSAVMKPEAARLVLLSRARPPPANSFRKLARPGQTVVVIGDAAKAGKSKEAIASAFEAALLGN